MTQVTATTTGRSEGASQDGFDVVTGAFSYSGAAIARELLAAGRQVRTLTGHPERAGRRSRHRRPPPRLRRSRGPGRSRCAAPPPSTTPIGSDSPTGASTTKRPSPTRRTLFYAARDAGVQRIVHVSITHPSITSPYPYFRGKAEVETGARRSRRLLRRAPPRHPLRRGRRPSQQHRLAPAPPAGVRRGRSGRLPHPTHPRRRPGPPERDARLAARHRGDRCGGARASDVHGTGLTDQGDRRQPRTHRADCRGRSCRSCRRLSGSCCATSCCHARNTSPWRRASPTPMAPPPGRWRCRSGWTGTPRRSAGRYANEIQRHFR